MWTAISLIIVCAQAGQLYILQSLRDAGLSTLAGRTLKRTTALPESATAAVPLTSFINGCDTPLLAVACGATLVTIKGNEPYSTFSLPPLPLLQQPSVEEAALWTTWYASEPQPGADAVLVQRLQELQSSLDSSTSPASDQMSSRLSEAALDVLALTNVRASEGREYQ